jgi:hypothetical protein
MSYRSPEILRKVPQDYYSILLSKLGEEADKIIDEECKGMLRTKDPYDSDCYDDSYSSSDEDEDERYNRNLEKFNSMISSNSDDEDEIKKPKCTYKELSFENWFDFSSPDIFLKDEDRYEEEEYDYDSDEYFQNMEDAEVNEIENDNVVELKVIPSMYKKPTVFKSFNFSYRKKSKSAKKVKVEKKVLDNKEEFDEIVNSIKEELISSTTSTEDYLIEKLRRFLLRQEIIGRLSRKHRRVRNSESVLKIILADVSYKSVSNSFLIFKLRINEYYIMRLIVHHLLFDLNHICKKTLLDMMEIFLIKYVAVQTPASRCWNVNQLPFRGVAHKCTH